MNMAQGESEELKKRIKLVESQLKKKDAEVRELVDTHLAKSNEYKKTIALLEQRIEL
jgi:hypothetical protein